MTTLQEAAQKALELFDAQWQCSRHYSLEEVQDVAEALRTALAQQGEPVAGWKFVPMEATKEMRMAAGSAYLDTHGYADSWIKAVYQAMLAAAPAAQPNIQTQIVGDISDDEILSIAHRKATRYAHSVAPGQVTYGFSMAHVLDFARAVEAAHGIVGRAG